MVATADNASAALLLTVLREPARAVELDLVDWDRLLRVARAARVLGQIAVRIEREGRLDRVPEPVRRHLQSILVVWERHRQVVRWEVDRIEAALADVDSPVLLLKGAAYLMAGLPCSAGRLFNDIDILVPPENLSAVDQALRQAGWEAAELAAGDERFYRQWLQELPPLMHGRRGTNLDVHHALLPRTDPLQIDVASIIESGRTVEGHRSQTPNPLDLLLHSAAHLFRIGEFRHACRDLLDMDGLVRDQCTQSDYGSRLLARSEQLDLRVPCFFAFRYLAEYFGTPIAPEVRRELAQHRPRWPSVRLVDRLMRTALIPRQLDEIDRRWERAARWLELLMTPRWRVIRTSLFWTKRFGRNRSIEHAA